MLGALAKLAVTRDPIKLCALVGEALTDGGPVAEGIIEATQKNSAQVVTRFCELTGLDAELVGSLPFIWLPVDGTHFGLVATEGERRGLWGVHSADQLMAAFLPRDGYSVASRRAQLRVVR